MLISCIHCSPSGIAPGHAECLRPAIKEVYGRGYPEEMKTRRLAEGDVEALWELRLRALESAPEAFGESAEEHRRTSMEAYAIRLCDGGDENFVIGAFVGSELVGMVGFYRELRLKRRHRGGIWGMFVTLSSRGQGVGAALLQDALTRAKSIPGLRSVHLSVTATQAAARRLYVSAGFLPFGTEPEALMVGDRYIDEEHMVLRF
jgi:RimJ/RimL family protein N-acetyltransferase